MSFAVTRTDRTALIAKYVATKGLRWPSETQTGYRQALKQKAGTE